MKITEQAYRLLETRYKSRNENVEDIYPRVARAIAKHAPDVANGFGPLEDEFLRMMEDADFLPNSPCIRNAGYSNMNKACISGNTLIYTKNGLVPMRDIKIGDLVLTHMGRYKPVTNIWSNGIKSTIKICVGRKGRLTHTCELTPDHRILDISGEWLDSNSVKKPKNIVPPKGIVPTKLGNTDNDKDLAWIIGFYLAEGDIYLNNANGNNPKKVIRFTNGNQNLMAKLKTISDSKTLNSGTICDSNFGNWKNLRLYNDTLADAFEKEFGKGFNTKRLPDWIYSASTEYKENLLQGILDGDGQKKYNTSRRIDLANQTLVFQLKLLAESLNYYTSIVFDTHQKGQTKPTARLIMNKTQPNKYLIIGEGYTEVFDMEVEEDHSFIAGEFIVHNCFVLPVEDSIQGIYKALLESAQIFKAGGGVGYNFSDLREEGALLSAGGTSSGALSFMNMFNASTEAVKQGGFRRGASMGVMDYDHPEIIRFIQEKGKYGRLNNFNVSVMLDDDFMKRVQKNDEIYLKSRLDKRKTVHTIKAKDLFNLISIYAWENGDPGVLFYNRINQDNPFYPNQAIRATNPCGEVPLFPYESCCLGSINLSNCVTSDGDLDKDKLKDMVYFGTLFLIGMNKATQFSIKECYTAQERYFRLGLGVMGYADMLMKMHILYDSAEALSTIDKIGKIMKLSAKFSPISVATRSIAPTGSLSILANCSSGIEPIFSSNYERHTTSGVFEEKRDNEYLRTAHEIEPIWHLKTLARWQKWIDNGVSKTINMPYNCSQSDVSDIYIKAWEMGCKGVTIFRDNCRGGEQVYKTKAPKCDGESCTL